MRCSICMATRNKSAALDMTLTSICRQEVPFDYEVIVADDGSIDDTRAVCQRHGVHYIYLDNDRYRNPARARNDAYRLATGEVIIAQSDDVLHHAPHTIERLVCDLQPKSVLIATVRNMNGDGTACHQPFHFYSGPNQPRAFFFLGSLWRSDLYAFGGNHEGFTEPCWDDNWFQDCVLHGRTLALNYAPEAVGHHQTHAFPPHSHDNADQTKKFYYTLRRDALQSRTWLSPGAPWPDQWPTIPKRMSFFWGGDRLSWMRYMTLASFRRHHPDWEMVLYRMAAADPSRWASYEQEDSAVYRGPDYSDKLAYLRVTTVPWTCDVAGASVTHACDLCQWHILSTTGGFYSDMDILYVAPLPEYTARSADAVFCLSLGYMTIGLMGAAPDSPVFASIYQATRQCYDPKRYQSTGADCIYFLAGLGAAWDRHKSPGRLAVHYFRNQHPTLRFRELPTETVYPFNYNEVDRIFNHNCPLPVDTAGIHWFGANPLAQKWNNILTAENVAQHDNTFARYARLT